MRKYEDAAWQQGLQQGKAEGLQQGKAEGLQQGKMAVAESMLKDGVAPEIVANSMHFTRQSRKQDYCMVILSRKQDY